MQDLINVTNQTPIEIAIGIDNKGMTTAGKLFDFLGMDRSNFSRWFRTNIIGNDFAEENTDYFLFVINDEHKGHASQDARITAGFAKKLSMQSKTIKGEQARQYFLKVEEKLKEIVHRTVPMTVPEQIQLLAMGNVELNQKVDNLDKKIDRLELDLPILGIEIDRITSAVHKKGVECLGGKYSEAYRDRSLRGKVYADIYWNLKQHFHVGSYKSIKRSQCDLAVSIIDGYQLPFGLMDMVRYKNAQLGLWGGVVHYE